MTGLEEWPLRISGNLIEMDFNANSGTVFLFIS
jgi:hypothetical protein